MPRVFERTAGAYKFKGGFMLFPREKNCGWPDPGAVKTWSKYFSRH
jgi:hypothetical protein